MTIFKRTNNDLLRPSPHLKSFFYDSSMENLGFPGGSAVKNLPANAGDKGSIPDPGRSHMPRSN